MWTLNSDDIHLFLNEEHTSSLFGWTMDVAWFRAIGRDWEYEGPPPTQFKYQLPKYVYPEYV